MFREMEESVTSNEDTGTSKAALFRAFLILGCAVMLAALYLLTIGHCFLPMPNVDSFTKERVEIRRYILVMPSQAQTLEGIYQRTKWRFLNPGQDRLFRVAVEIDRADPHTDNLLQKSLVEMGYKFPNGCRASSGEGGTRIQHYPSMLNRMERDLHLRCVSVTALDPAGQLIEKMKRAARTNPQPATVDSGN